MPNMDMRPPTPAGLPRRKLLRNGLLLGAAVGGGGIASGAFANKAQAATYGPQSEWAWCKWCNVLFYYPHSSTSGPCPGLVWTAPHNGSTSWNYGLGYNDTVSESNPQSGWRWCGNCQQLFYGPKMSDSRCPYYGGDANHVIGRGSYNYALIHDNPNLNGGQGGWYWCNICQSLFYGGGSREAYYCAQGDLRHNGSESDVYYLFYFSKTI